MTRSLIFLMVKMRSNIVFTIISIICFSKKNFYQYIKAIQTIFKYFKVCWDWEINYSRTDKKTIKIQSFFDFN